jgi:HEAT repeat protein
MPVPAAVKKKAKPVIDTVADRAGTATTGVLWLLVTVALGTATTRLVIGAAVVALGILSVWMGLILRTRVEYVQAFRVALPGPVPDPHAIRVDLRDRRQREAVRRALRDADERAVTLALRALQATPRPPAWRELRALVDHPAASIRARAWALLGAAGDDTLIVKARRAAGDAEAEVRAAAVRYLAVTTSHGVDELIEHPDVRARLAALAYLAQQSPLEAARASGHIAELSAGPLGEDPALRREIAAAVGALPAAEARPHLRRLLRDRDPQVAWAAGASAARVGDLSHVRPLLERLAAEREVREAAAAALRGHGAAAVGPLAEALADPTLAPAARKAIPGLLGAVGTQSAADALVKVLARDVGLRPRIVRALGRLRRQERVSIDAGALEDVIHEEARRYAAHLYALHLEEAAANGDPGALLLRRALAEKLDDDLERIFRLLGLRYPEKELLAAYYGLRADEAALRASALEFLDNVLENPLKRELVSVLEADGPAMASGLKRAWPRRAPAGSRVEALRGLAADPDPWLRACAVYAIGEARLAELAPEVAAAARDDDARVREAAWLAATGSFRDRGADKGRGADHD